MSSHEQQYPQACASPVPTRSGHSSLGPQRHLLLAKTSSCTTLIKPVGMPWLVAGRLQPTQSSRRGPATSNVAVEDGRGGIKPDGLAKGAFVLSCAVLVS